jgi:nicotinamidase-related amidase
MLLNAQGSLLLVVDVQERLLPAIHDAERILQRIEIMVRAAGMLGVPVMATEQYPRGLGRTAAALSELLPEAVRVEKIHFCAAAEPELMSRLEAARRRQIVLCGTEAHVCVLQTALGLAAAGYDCAVVADAAGSRDPANRQAALDRLRAEGIAILTSEMVLFEWMARADTAEFRQILPLVR